uniref:Large ribosomal subunit protein uL24c n=1 Tax=Gracilariopsis longissima TaxID=172976 RepID=A0A345U9P5_9FLOR|nr:ribosomal protein L24 [Gracilariopsis longissima]AXI97181.1 ribosomal protein L24 [Gracilariopsis longissima]UAD89097.1 ribosomal protein L24 [Gracilariopsis longissima]
MKNNKKKQKMHVKIGETVKVISGKDKGKIGKITKILHRSSKIIVENINICTKHIKAQKEANNGKIITIAMPIHSSKVILQSTKKKIANP